MLTKLQVIGHSILSGLYVLFILGAFYIFYLDGVRHVPDAGLGVFQACFLAVLTIPAALILGIILLIIQRSRPIPMPVIYTVLYAPAVFFILWQMSLELFAR